MGLFDAIRTKPKTAPTFNERVEHFWSWYQDVAPRFFATIEAGKCSSLAAETSTKVKELFPRFAWVFGPGANNQGHSFTLSGEGNIHRQLLALQWLSQAPALPGWTFYAARQPGPIAGHVIKMSGIRFDPKEIWITPAVDEQNERIDITVWHPQWEHLDSRRRNTVTFLFLDEALGEYGTDWWIGEIRYDKKALGASFPFPEFPDYIDQAAQKRGWKKHAPGDSWTLYRLKEQATPYPRSDVVIQNTCVPRLFTSYLDACGELEDPLAGTGADYVYVSIASDFFPEGQQVERRGQLEEAIETELKEFGGGRCIGGATGRERCYSDFLIFDGGRSLEAIRKTLQREAVPPGTMIEFFAREKRGRRIAV
jgi:hypothetical protein